MAAAAVVSAARVAAALGTVDLPTRVSSAELAAVRACAEVSAKSILAARTCSGGQRQTIQQQRQNQYGGGDGNHSDSSELTSDSDSDDGYGAEYGLRKSKFFAY
jgi:hypothetical protein